MRVKDDATTLGGVTVKQIRRGLVLAGGGAKGAYAFGALKAFAEHGIEFAGVAGTSVGALNAVLWSTGSLAEGEELWQNLSFEKLYPVSLGTGFRIRSLMWTRCALHVALNLLLCTLKGMPFRGDTLVWSLFCALTFCLMVLLPYTLLGPTALAGVIMWLPTVGMERMPWGRQMRFIGRFSGSYWSLGVTGYSLLHVFPSLGLFLHHLSERLGHIVDAISNHLPMGPVWIVFYALLISVLTLPLLFTPLVLLIPAGILSLLLKGLSSLGVVFDTELLHSTVDEILAKPLRVPTWVTTSVLGVRSDTGWAQGTVDDAMQAGGYWGRSEWQARYANLGAIPSAETRASLCMASAALPFGFTEPVSVAGVLHVDGGLTDNCPLSPLFGVEGMEEIFIVLLSAYPNDEAAMKQVRVRGTRVVPFYSKKSLGNAITGTLNFHATYSNQLVRRGFTETRARLASLTSMA